jgi:hypothetical protein
VAEQRIQLRAVGREAAVAVDDYHVDQPRRLGEKARQPGTAASRSEVEVAVGGDVLPTGLTGYQGGQVGDLAIESDSAGATRCLSCIDGGSPHGVLLPTVWRPP